MAKKKVVKRKAVKKRVITQHQTGKTTVAIDRQIRAYKPGKRKAKKGKGEYYEYRKNRSDLYEYV